MDRIFLETTVSISKLVDLIVDPGIFFIFVVKIVDVLAAPTLPRILSRKFRPVKGVEGNHSWLVVADKWLLTKQTILTRRCQDIAQWETKLE